MTPLDRATNPTKSFMLEREERLYLAIDMVVYGSNFTGENTYWPQIDPDLRWDTEGFMYDTIFEPISLHDLLPDLGDTA